MKFCMHTSLMKTNKINDLDLGFGYQNFTINKKTFIAFWGTKNPLSTRWGVMFIKHISISLDQHIYIFIFEEGSLDI